jgi:hypothetical protein
MRKLLIVSFFAFASTFSALAQDTIALWPIFGKKAGENILYKPQDYIGTEKSFDALFIGAPEGTLVLSPVDGTIIHVSYGYKATLFTSNSSSIDNPPTTKVADFDLKQRKEMAKEQGVNPQYISLSIGISCSNNEKFWIQGIRPIQYLKTGAKIKKGEVIGTVGFCYKLIAEPCIWLSRSLNSKSADPMTPFGLKTSFIPYKSAPIREEIPVNELLVDFDVFRQALEDGHPGLYDYTSKANMDSTFNRIRQKITKPISPSKFLRLLYPVLDSIRDSHTALYNVSGQKDSPTPSENSDIPVHFGYQHDSLMIFSTTVAYKHLLRKSIESINGISASELYTNIPIYYHGEGNNCVEKEWTQMTWFYAYYKHNFKYKKGDSLNFVFTDGTKECVKYQPDIKWTDFSPTKVWKKDPMQSNLEMKHIDKNIAYMRIKSFDFSDIDNDSLRLMMSSLCNSSCKNLIIDIRDNLGGNGAYGTLFSMLANKPFKNGLGSMVKSNSQYKFLKYVPSYAGVDTTVLFGDYKKENGKEGYYSMNKTMDKPNKDVNYAGNVYVLTNERAFSASTLFAALIHKYKRGVIVGRETGTCYYQMNATKGADVHLKHAGLDLHIPLVKSVFDDQYDPSIPWGHGVIPDHIIEWTYDEYINNADPILDYTLKLIHESK